MNKDEYLTSSQGLTQIKPELSRDEQMAFIDTLRETQTQRNQQIADQTRALGSDVPYSHGGLGGSNYFLSRYQNPQVDSMVADLKTAAQAQALNQALKNYQANLKERYRQSYRNYAKRAGSGSSVSPSSTYIPGGVETDTTAETVDNALFDELALRNLTGKTLFDLQQEFVKSTSKQLGLDTNKQTPSKKTSQQQKNASIFGDAFGQYKIGQ